MGIEDKYKRRAIEKADEARYGITPDEKDDFTDERTTYRNEFDEGLQKQIAHQEEQITTDELTGLANRRGFVNELEKTMESMRQSFGQHTERRSKEQSALEEFSLLFIDLDNFKRVNDALGHAAGDDALKRVAEILKSSVRKGSVVARFHGDEFAVFLPRVREEEAETIAENILKNLENDLELQRFQVSASIGVRHITKSDLSKDITPKSLTDEADMQQVKAKQGGKGKIEVYRTE